MSLDHIAKISGFSWLDGFIMIGCLAFPIFSYLIMFHLHEQKCFKKYLHRLLFFGVLTSCLLIPFGWHFNVLYSFFISILTIGCFVKIHELKQATWVKGALHGMAFCCGLAISFFTDYSVLGFCYLLALYGYFTYKNVTFTGLVLLFALSLNPTNLTYAVISLLTTMVLMSVTLTPSKRYIRNKYFFYIYYPAHLVVLLGLKASGFFG